MSKVLSEFIGTFMLVSAVCGAALFSAAAPGNGAGILGVSLAAGISVLAMAYAVGPISGGHFNPAVTCGLVSAGRFPARNVPAYVVAQTLGGICAATLFYFVATSRPEAALGNFASNGYAAASPGGFSLEAVFFVEVILTALFLVVICGATSRRAKGEFAPIAIGLALTAFHLMAIPVSNASLNPARSTATAIFGGSQALGQLWLFWLAPIVGGLIGGLISRLVTGSEEN